MGKRALGIFLLRLSCILITPAATLASGCLGGDWYQVSKGTIGQRAIQPIRGNSGMSAQVYRHYAKVSYDGVQFSDETSGKEIEFISSVFDPDDIHVPDLFRQLEALPLKYDVAIVETIETNPYYDDCADIPENTKRSKITYEFSIKMPDGKIILFTAFGEVHDTSPP
jgi:hypothetical protein